MALGLPVGYRAVVTTPEGYMALGGGWNLECKPGSLVEIVEVYTNPRNDFHYRVISLESGRRQYVPHFTLEPIEIKEDITEWL